MDNPFTPTWDEQEDCFVSAVDPETWLAQNHPSGELSDHTENGLSGMLFNWGTGTLFVAPAAQYLKLTEGDDYSFIGFNQSIDHFVNDDGDLVALDASAPVCLMGSPNEWTVLYKDGTSLIERVDGIFLSRSLMTSDGVFSWPERFTAEGIEMSESSIFFGTDRLATHVDGQWQWHVPDEHVVGVKDIIADNFGVRL